jgi:PTS system nitrogen regulatory IIA component
MDLKIKDIVELLKISEKTLYRWLKEKKIPAYKINQQYRFSRTEINEWLLKNKISFTEKVFDLAVSSEPLSLRELVAAGRIEYNIIGSTITEVIRNAVNSISLPQGLDRETVIDALLKREELMSTGIGHGIAIPHPRNPVITDAASASVSICMLASGIDFKSLDRVPVHTLFIVLSANPKRHLEALSQISFTCQRDDFRKLLEERADRQAILSYLETIEQEYLGPEKRPQ